MKIKIFIFLISIIALTREGLSVEGRDLRAWYFEIVEKVKGEPNPSVISKLRLTFMKAGALLKMQRV